MTRQEQIVEAAEKYSGNNEEMRCHFIDGCHWADEHPDLYTVTRKAVERALKNLWYDANGDVLPEIDREVIVLCNNGKVCFGHRPHEYVAGVSLDGKMTYMEAKTYGKGGWNIPDVCWWLDCVLPNMEGQQ